MNSIFHPFWFLINTTINLLFFTIPHDYICMHANFMLILCYRGKKSIDLPVVSLLIIKEA